MDSPERRRMLILADDLTGACDAAAAFMREDCAPEIVIDPARAADRRADVLAIDLDLREAPPDAARASVRETLARRDAPGSRGLYLKIDSLMRGPVEAILAGALDVVPGDALIALCPAFPETGRSVAGGTVLIEGRPIDAAPAAIEVGARGPASLAERLGASPPTAEALRNGRLVVFDASTRRELDDAAKRLLAAGRPVVFAGSGGLARSLAPAGRPPRESPRLRTLWIGGSASARLREQLALLNAASYCAGPDGFLPAEVGNAMLDAAAAGRDVVLTLPRATGVLDPAVVTAMASDLGGLVSSFERVFLAGGATARAALTAWSADRIRLLAEPEPGIVRGRVELSHGALDAILKSGGFGDARCLSRLATP